MSIHVKCPHCGTETQADPQYAGTSGPCRSCGQTLTIPANPFAEDAAISAAKPAKTTNPWIPILAVLAAVAVLGLVVMGILAALLLPAVNAAREAARRTNCMNSARQIQLALLNYEAANGSFPPAYIADENGKPMHSWRVLILPYLEETAIFNQYDMTKPWDSPENLALTQSYCPPVYQCPSDLSLGATTNTSYLGVAGPGMFFNNDRPQSLRDITDGTSRTIAVVEVMGSNVHWAEPRDYDTTTATFQINTAPGDIGSNHGGGGAIVSFADGHVQFFAAGIPPETIKSQCTIAAGD